MAGWQTIIHDDRHTAGGCHTTYDADTAVCRRSEEPNACDTVDVDMTMCLSSSFEVGRRLVLRNSGLILFCGEHHPFTVLYVTVKPVQHATPGKLKVPAARHN